MTALVHSDGQFLVTRIDAHQIEEFIAKVGWEPIKDADTTPADRAELKRIKAKGWAETPERSPAEHEAWWRCRISWSFPEREAAAS